MELVKRYPLLFTFRDKVSGDGFLADVTTHGRALAVCEADEWWMYGVQPGGLSGGGTTLLEAHADFRRAFTAVLFQLAVEAPDFWSFRDAVARFFAETDDETVQEWNAAVVEVRAGRVTAKELPVAPNGIREMPADSPRHVEVERKQKFSAADNQLDPQMAVAA